MKAKKRTKITESCRAVPLSCRTGFASISHSGEPTWKIYKFHQLSLTSRSFILSSSLEQSWSPDSRDSAPGPEGWPSGPGSPLWMLLSRTHMSWQLALRLYLTKMSAFFAKNNCLGCEPEKKNKSWWKKSFLWPGEAVFCDLRSFPKNKDRSPKIRINLPTLSSAH